MKARQLIIKLVDGDTIKGFELQSDRKDGVEFIHSEGGTAFIPHDDIKNVKVGGLTKVEVAAPVTPSVPTIKRTERKDGKTKFDLVMEVLSARKDLLSDRKTAISVLMAEVGMTEGGASTYFSQAKKALTNCS